MGKKIPTVVVTVNGGLVQDVIADGPVEVIVVDYDVEGSEDPRLVKVPRDNPTPQCEHDNAYVLVFDAEVTVTGVDKFKKLL